MNGFLNINKPSGMTSYDVIRRLKPCLPKTKIGHLGTLDPLASGVLPIAVGWATRVIGYINDNTKEYQVEMVLGGVSDTQDRTGRINLIPCQPVDGIKIGETLEQFVGEIDQVPPMFSAVHYQGRRLYEWARQGTDVPVKSRRVTIHYITLQQILIEDNRQIVRFMIGCSSGTYVRTICHDVGQQLGCGAYLSCLTRTRSGPFTLSESSNLENLINNPEGIAARLLPVDYPLQGIPKVEVLPSIACNIKNGSSVAWAGVEDHKHYLIYDHEGVLLAIARGKTQDTHEVLQPEKVLTGGKN